MKTVSTGKEGGHMIEQLSLFPSPAITDPRPPETITWNLWHGCSKASTGCQFCYMFRRDEAVGKDPTVVRKTQAFNLPTRILRAGQYKGYYKVPAGSMIFTCFSSDFFHIQCVENGVTFSFHQTGAKLVKDGKEYQIPREYQHEQARKACLDFNPQKGLLGLRDIPGE
jgi:hypothetical protein